MTDRLTFNEESHEYFWDNQRVPCVTDILEDTGIIDFGMVKQRHLDFGMERGSIIHLACALFDEDDLDWDTVAEEAMPYVKAWERFTKDTGFKPLIIESSRYSEQFVFAGTPDVAGTLSGRKVLIERKSNTVPKYTPLQLAAYQHLLKDEGPFAERYGIALCDNGKYKLSNPYIDPNDFAVFTCALAVYKWKKG